MVYLGRDNSSSPSSAFGPVISRTLSYSCGPISQKNSDYRLNFKGINNPGRTPSYSDIKIAPSLGLRIGTPENRTAFSSSVILNTSGYTGLATIPPNTSGTVQILFQLTKGTAITSSIGLFSAPAHILLNASVAHYPYTVSATADMGATHGEVIVPTCLTKSLMVNLPTVKPTSFASVGSTTGSMPFSIETDCPVGAPVKILMTLTDYTTPSNRTAILSLVPERLSAKGVGIQIARNPDIVYYGPDSAVAGNANQFLVGTFGGETSKITIPFTASYIRTGNVTPGSVKAVATYTMSYQ